MLIRSERLASARRNVMARPNVVTLDTRLMVAASLEPKLEAMDEVRFAAFEAAVDFARSEIGGALAAADQPKFLIAHGDFLLAIRFCPRSEAFLIVSFEDGDDDPPGGGKPAAHSRGTLAEALLRASGVAARTCEREAHISPKPSVMLMPAVEGESLHAWKQIDLGATSLWGDVASGDLLAAAATLRDSGADAGKTLFVRVCIVGSGTTGALHGPIFGFKAPDSGDR